MYTYLPGVFPEKQDGGLAPLVTSIAPKVLVLGTAESGFSETPYLVGRPQEAALLFGTGGTLIRGMYEARAAGSESTLLFRIGATPAILEGIGDSAGSTGYITIETARQDDSAGDDYSMYWDDTAHRLVVKEVDTDVIVYDRDFDNPDPTIDRGAVVVSGKPAAGGGVDIGSASSFLTLTEVGADAATYKVTFTAGTDGTSPSRMKLYELLHKSYKQLENVDFDIIVPMDIYLDDLNVADMDSTEVGASDRNLVALSDYPTAGSDQDVLGKVYTEEYNGISYFWWWMPSDPSITGSSNIDALFTSDGGANIAPSVGSASATTKADGSALSGSDFHEVNFAYQLADFCWVNSVNNQECTGVVGVLPPASVSLSDVLNWVGKLPTYTTDSNGNQTITGSTYDGSGLLGNKFMAGKYGFRSNKAGGGFIGTNTHFMDGTELSDQAGHLIDIGKYISVVAGWVTLYNSFDTSGLGYSASGAASYAGFYSALPAKSAPTNKTMGFMTLPFRVNNTKQDQLAGVKYVMFRDLPKGTVCTDAMTAARHDSDYRRLTTVRIIKDVIDAVRAAADPFIGEAGGAAQRAALQTAIEGALDRKQKAKEIQRYDLSITATAAQSVAGEAIANLVIVPAFELRRIPLTISLKAQ